MLPVKNDVVRDCHSDLRLHMSVVTLSQLRNMLSFAVKFARLVEGENSTEYKTAVHWSNQLDTVQDEFYSKYRPDSDSVTPFSPILHTYYD